MTKYSIDELKEIKKSPWNFFIKHKKVTTLVILICTLWGFTSFNGIPKEIQPEVELPFGSVFTVYPGANPLDVEELVTNKIETAIANVDDIKTISSTSQFGMSSVIAEFESGTNVDDAIVDLRDAVEKAKGKLPADANDPITASFSVNSFPVIVFSLLSDIPADQLKTVAEDVQNDLEKVTGVSDVNIIGARDKQIEINVNPTALEEYEINIDQIVQSIKASNLNFPIGVIENDGVKYTLRVEAEVTSAYELSQIPIKQFFNESGSVKSIKLSDIAKIEEKFQEKTTIARVGIPENGTIKNAISLQIYKKDSANIVDVAESAKDELELMKGLIIPETVDVHISNDNSEYLTEDFTTLGANGIATVILILAFLFVFLGIKEGLISAISIPLSMLITMAVLYSMGQSLNSLTLFSLVFALGLLIDNAVIIVEGIYENLKSGEYTSYGAAVLGVYEFKWPIIAGTLTTVFAFLP
ncbi:efflux RND transporter permease subunit, partial [Patescibacteria group bacterium]